MEINTAKRRRKSRVVQYGLVAATMFVAAVIAALVWSGNSPPPMVCDKFKINATLDGTTLTLSLETDLPPETDLQVTVLRTYREPGKSPDFPHDYFSENSTVGRWVAPRTITLSDEKWMASLHAAQQGFNKSGEGFQVKSVSDDITVLMLVPDYQKDPRFGGLNNVNLRGKAVSFYEPGSKLRVVQQQVALSHPMDYEPSAVDQEVRVDPQALAIGGDYAVARQTPLMPLWSFPEQPLPDNPEPMKPIPPGGTFTVLARRLNRQTPWYEVRAYRPDGAEIGRGWINSIALLGQKLRPSK